MTGTATDTHDPEIAQRLTEATQRADTLRAVIESISGDLALEPVLTRIVESAVTLLGAQHGAIGLAVETPAGPVMRLVAGYHLPLLELFKDFPPGVGLAGSVLREQRPVRLDRYDHLDQIARGDIADHTLLGVPIWWAERTIGFIGVGAPPPHRFDDRAEETLMLFAQHAAIAIEIARRFENEHRRVERVATINQIGRLLTSELALDQLLQTAVDALTAHFNRQTIAVMLVDPHHPETLVLRARGGVYVDSNLGEYRQSIGDGIAGAAARSRRPLLINDVRTDPRYISVVGGDKLVAELAVPLVAGDRLVGLLNIEAEQPFTEEDAADFEIIAAQLAIAVENARLFAGTQEALDDARLLYETSRRMSVALDTQEVVEAYLEHVAIRRRYKCAVTLMEHDDQATSTAVVVHGRWSPQEGMTFPNERLPISRDAFDPELDAGRTVTITDFRTDPRVSGEFRRRHLMRGTLPALAMIPLLVGGRRIGLVILSSPEPRVWEESDLHPYAVTAAQLAAAIDSCEQRRQLAERRRQVAVLEERQRLARELHDSVTQSIFSATLIAETLGAAWQQGTEEGARRVERMQALSRSALAELRALVAELRPAGSADEPDLASLDDGSVAAIMRVRRDGIVNALSHHATAIAEDGMQVEVRADGYVPQPADREQVLFRVAQEALHNIIKYARARAVTVTLATDADSTHLVIEDDGIGFAVPSAAEIQSAGTVQGGHGLAIMRERTEALGGALRVTSAPYVGTRVDLRVPRKDRGAS